MPLPGQDKEETSKLPSVPSAKSKNDLNVTKIKKDASEKKKEIEEAKKAGNIVWQTEWGKNPEWRLDPNFKVLNRIKTNIKPLDNIFGGLPRGLSLFYGESGTGKSKLAKIIAINCKELVLYFIAESPDDKPKDKSEKLPKNVRIVDYISYPTEALKVTQQVIYFLRKFQPRIAIIDSFTAMLSKTKKAVAEADVRTPIWNIAKEIERLNQIGEIECALIGTSQTRSKSAYLHTAGGEGIKFAGSMTIFFEKRTVDAKWDVELYGVPRGSVVYLMTVQKDRQGVAKQDSQYMIQYDQESNLIPSFIRIAEGGQ